MAVTRHVIWILPNSSYNILESNGLQTDMVNLIKAPIPTSAIPTSTKPFCIDSLLV